VEGGVVGREKEGGVDGGIREGRWLALGVGARGKGEKQSLPKENIHSISTFRGSPPYFSICRIG